MEYSKGKSPEQGYDWAPVKSLNFMERSLCRQRNIKEGRAVTGTEKLLTASHVPHILVGTVTAKIPAPPYELWKPQRRVIQA